MGRLFNRAVKVTISKPSGENFFGADANRIEISKLRVAFELEKTLRKQPNNGHVVITNLSEQTRGFLKEPGLRIRLEAGYEDETRQIFYGDIRFSQSLRKGTEWETRIDLGDGERAYRYARVNRSFKAGAKVSDALRDVAAQMGLTLPASVSDAELQTEFASGLSLYGPAQSELSKLLAPYGYDWSIQDGELLILKNGSTRAREIVLVSPLTGMIGSPEFAAPTKKKQKPVLTVRTLINADIVPGGRILVKSANISGVFKVLKCNHAGDTHEKDWFTLAEAKAIN